MEYIEKILGLPVVEMPWEHLAEMPYFIQDKEVAEKIRFKPFILNLYSSCFLSVLNHA